MRKIEMLGTKRLFDMMSGGHFFKGKSSMVLSLMLASIFFLGGCTSVELTSSFDLATSTDAPSADNPFLINTPEELALLATLVNSDARYIFTDADDQEEIAASYGGAWYRLVNDLDLSEDYTHIPIGDERDQFRGSFDGNDKTISNLTLSEFSKDRGLFGVINFGKISNLTLSNVNATHTATGSYRSTSLGALGGIAMGGSITNVNVYDAKIAGAGDVGGLLGRQIIGTIEGSSATGTFTSSGDTFSVGGLVGLAYEIIQLNSDTSSNAEEFVAIPALIMSSYATGTVIGTGTETSIGGLVGSSSGLIIASYSTANVSDSSAGTGGTILGGLVGTCDGTVLASYATGDVTASGTKSTLGALVGALETQGSIINSYALGGVTASVTGTGSTFTSGGLIGMSTGQVSFGFSYWNSDNFTETRTALDPTNYGTGYSTSELKTSPFIYLTWTKPGAPPFDMVYWDIVTTGYPVLDVAGLPTVDEQRMNSKLQ